MMLTSSRSAHAHVTNLSLHLHLVRVLLGVVVCVLSKLICNNQAVQQPLA